ncbi:hypothetical protein DPMN_084309 [Dreissena polymorpha]|uniref:Uncharacterized protein n=1 Tax=Dreissena polymorpha TaxID=45954 RepID=A0A9D3YAT5_DREPO|nr:hypothetical protein DPMN_084309 [Dreissena polymorpha]
MEVTVDLTPRADITIPADIGSNEDNTKTNATLNIKNFRNVTHFYDGTLIKDTRCSEITKSFVSRARSALIQVSHEDDSSDSEPEQVIQDCDELASLHKFMQG